MRVLLAWVCCLLFVCQPGNTASASDHPIPALESPNVYEGIKRPKNWDRDSWYWGFEIGLTGHIPIVFETPDYLEHKPGIGFAFIFSVDFLERFQALAWFKGAWPALDDGKVADHFNYNEEMHSGHLGGGLEGRWFPTDIDVGSGGTVLRPFVGLCGGGNGLRSTHTDYDEETEETYTYFEASYSAGYVGPTAGLRLDIPIPDFTKSHKRNYVTFTLDALYHHNFFSKEVITEDNSKDSERDISDELKMDSLFLVFGVGMLL